MLSGVIVPIDRTHTYPYSQAKVVPIATTKKKTGTRATLLVSAKKSAAVSMILIETLRLFKLHKRINKYKAAKIQSRIAPAIKSLSFVSPAYIDLASVKSCLRAKQTYPPASRAICTVITDNQAHW